MKSGRVQDVPFLYQLDDPDGSMEAASLKILYSVLCERQNQQNRKRRSVTDINNKNYLEDEPLAFTSWDQRHNSTVSEKSCMTFQTTLNYIDNLILEFSRLMIQGENVVEFSE